MKFNGVELMKETANLTSAALVNDHIKSPTEGMTFAEIMWTDRNLFIVTRVFDDKHFCAKPVKTEMKDWTDGYQYPVTDKDGNIVTDGTEEEFFFAYRYWRRGGKRGAKVRLCFGAKTGYRDPSF